MLAVMSGQKNEIALRDVGILSNVDKTLYPAESVTYQLKHIMETNPVNTPPLLLNAMKDRFCYTPIKAIEDKNLSAQQIEIAINVMLADRGFNMSDDDMKYLKITMIKTIQSTPKYENMTLKEIKEAFHKGVRGEFGEYMGINVVSLESWLDSYIEQYTNRAIGEYIKANQKLKRIEDDKLTKEAWIESMDKSFQHFKEDQETFRDYRQWLFIFAGKNGLVDWKKLEKDENKRIRSKNKKEFTLMKRAEHMVVAEETLSYKARKKVATFARREILQSELNHIREAVESGQYKNKYSLRNRVYANFRLLLVKVWLRQLIKDGIELKDLLENAGTTGK